MFRRKKHIENIMGHEIAPPNMTKWGAFYILKHLGAPLIGFLALMELIVFLIFRYAFDMPYGIYSWFF